MGGETQKYNRLDDGFLKRVDITKDEKILIISLSFLSIGFLLQILDFFI